jgi:hypothetical protein
MLRIPVKAILYNRLSQPTPAFLHPALLQINSDDSQLNISFQNLAMFLSHYSDHIV